jgi:hypothetical protein
MQLKGGFEVPLHTNIVLLPNSVYRNDPPRFEASAADFERGVGFPLPEWTMAMSNSLTYVLSSNGRILDFVLLRGLTNANDFGSTIFSFGPNLSEPTSIAQSWSTNRLLGSTDVRVPTEGLMQQVRISDIQIS